MYPQTGASDAELYERPGAFGVGGREQGRRWAQAERGHALATQVVQERQHVVGDCLGEATLLVGQRVRCPTATRVEPDRTGERGQPLQEPRECRLIPHEVDGDPQRMKDEDIRVAVADNLVGDATHSRVRVPRH